MDKLEQMEHDFRETQRLTEERFMNGELDYKVACEMLDSQLANFHERFRVACGLSAKPDYHE